MPSRHLSRVDLPEPDAAQDDHHLAAVDRHADAVEHDLLVVADDEVADLDRPHRGSTWMRRSPASDVQRRVGARGGIFRHGASVADRRHERRPHFRSGERPGPEQRGASLGARRMLGTAPPPPPEARHPEEPCLSFTARPSQRRTPRRRRIRSGRCRHRGPPGADPRDRVARRPAGGDARVDSCRPRREGSRRDHRRRPPAREPPRDARDYGRERGWRMLLLGHRGRHARSHARVRAPEAQGHRARAAAPSSRTGSTSTPRP